MASIFAAIESQEQAIQRRQPSKAYTKWRNEALKPSPDFAAAQVRVTINKEGIGRRKCSEEAAIEKAVGVKFDSLPFVERRAAKILTGQGRVTRNPHDKANEIARAVQAEWGSPAIYPRQCSPRLTLEKIILTAVPFIEELSGEKLRGTTPDNDQCIKMEPPEFGALMALARMYKKGASVEYACDILTKHRAQHIDKTE